MDKEALLGQMKALKAKARAARKEGRKELSRAFKSGAARLTRKIKAIRSVVAKVTEKV